MLFAACRELGKRLNLPQIINVTGIACAHEGGLQACLDTACGVRDGVVGCRFEAVLRAHHADIVRTRERNRHPIKILTDTAREPMRERPTRQGSTAVKQRELARHHQRLHVLTQAIDLLHRLRQRHVRSQQTRAFSHQHAMSVEPCPGVDHPHFERSRIAAAAAITRAHHHELLRGGQRIGVAVAAHRTHGDLQHKIGFVAQLLADQFAGRGDRRGQRERCPLNGGALLRRKT